MAEFSTGAILSAISGKLVCDFSELHACIEAMAGGPVFTHQLPAVMRALEPAVRAAFPDIADWDLSEVDRDTYATWRAEREHLLSEMRTVTKFGEPPRSPFEHLPENSNVIVVQVGE